MYNDQHNNASYFFIDIISKQVKEKIAPLPKIDFQAVHTEDGKDILIVEVNAGSETPYFYSADGNLIAFVRIGSDSQPTPPNLLRELVLKGKNLTWICSTTTLRYIHPAVCQMER